MSGETFPTNPSIAPDADAFLELLTAEVLGSYENVPPGARFKLIAEPGTPNAAEPDVAAAVVLGIRPPEYYIFRRSGPDEGNWFEWSLLDAGDVPVMPVALLGAGTRDPGVVSGGLVRKGAYFQFVRLGIRAPDAVSPDGQPGWAGSSAVEVVKGYNLGKIITVEWPWDNHALL